MSLSTSIGRTCSRRKICLAAILFLLIPLPTWSGPHRHTPRPITVHDPGYVFALGTANRFLHAWQTGDLETGMVLISDQVRRSHNADALEQFFSGDADRAYEIGRGRGQPGRYCFPVVLITQAGGLHRRFSEMMLVRTSRNDWAIDKLP